MITEDPQNDMPQVNPELVVLKKKRKSHYRCYSLQFKLSVLEELHTSAADQPISVVAEKYGVPRYSIIR